MSGWADDGQRSDGGDRPEETSQFLRIDGVDVVYSGNAVLKGLSMDIRESAVTALIGPNGAGKTTALDVITGFTPPHRGTVVYQGRDLHGVPPPERARRGIVRVFQEARPFQMLSVLDNVLVAIPGQQRQAALWRCLDCRRSRFAGDRRAREEAERVLARVGLEGAEGMKAQDLSYGQQKLLGLARGLATRPKVLLLDEPSAGVSPILADEMIALVREFAASGTTVVIVEHNLPMVERCADVVVLMDLGHVVISGLPEGILGNEELGRRYFGFSMSTDGKEPG